MDLSKSNNLGGADERHKHWSSAFRLPCHIGGAGAGVSVQFVQGKYVASSLRITEYIYLDMVQATELSEENRNRIGHYR